MYVSKYISGTLSSTPCRGSQGGFGGYDRGTSVWKGGGVGDREWLKQGGIETEQL